ncbi:MAG: SdpI family protein [Chloroflexota bacterium]
MKNLTRLLIFTAVVAVIMFLVSAWAWQQIPAGEQVPVHWNAAGEADRFGSKFEGLLLMPIIMVVVMGVVAAVTFIEPKRRNLLQSHRAFGAFWIAISLFFLMLHVTMTLITLGYAIPINIAISVGLGLLFIVIGNFLGKIRSTYTFGIRTPWTLDSELSWNKTHRLGGKLFMLAGVATLLSGLFFDGEILVVVMLVSILGAALVSTVYSYFVWKQDPEIQAREAA